ncbi:amyloid fiber anchoring/assembly protein TapA [Bacillus massilinigeriensis]|uniref:amyloid fiber anchoring/assembly protein TapA n=1 Tax=Bacillus mediterraneensis TaxID=1805474 RepID=UPI0008F7E634|nr:amyloid fiber anchoring/assembly protein TapA [Bacillus mediterraneensis]
MRQAQDGRIKKFGRKNQPVKIAARLLGIGYGLFFTLVLLSGNTLAFFHDASEVSGSITAGTWQEEWDKSSLKFINGSHEQTVNSCPPAEIAVEVNNGGSDMKGQTEYEVYFAPSGNPKKGTKVGEGKIEPILSGKTALLKFQATKAGNYKFKAYQRPGHANKYESRGELWSETVTVKCQKIAPLKEEKQQPEAENPTSPQPAQETKPEQGATRDGEQQQPEKGSEPPSVEQPVKEAQPPAGQEPETTKSQQITWSTKEEARAAEKGR